MNENSSKHLSLKTLVWNELQCFLHVSAAGILPAHNVGSGLEGGLILVLGDGGDAAGRLGPPFLQGPLAWAPNIARIHIVENGKDLRPRPVLHHEVQLFQAPRRPCEVGGEDHQAHRHLWYTIVIINKWDVVSTVRVWGFQSKSPRPKGH